MDRFIVNVYQAMIALQYCLKTNMDRFIEDIGAVFNVNLEV